MEALKIILTILYVIVCVAIVVLVLLQDEKAEGLSAAITGGSISSSSYYSKNKSRSKEGRMNTITVVLGFVFVILSFLLNFSIFQ